jgi:hypothetical protein
MRPSPQNEFDPSEYPVAPECAAALESLQRRLDGDEFPERESITLHRAQCSSCREREAAARRLVEGLRRTEMPSPPPGLSDRVIDGLKAEPFRRRIRRFKFVAACLALAACIVIAIFIADDFRNTQTRVVSSSIRKAPPEGPGKGDSRPAPLQDSLNEAGSAVASLTRKTATETIFSKIPPLTLPKVPAAAPFERLEPAVASIQDVQHGAVFGVAPITNSAKRAANMIWREIGPDSPKSPIN